MQNVVIATQNIGKAKEINAFFEKQFEDKVITIKGRPVTFNLIHKDVNFSPEETGLSFIENAIIKAREASRLTDLPAIADDSGLSVNFLDGEPGIYSARYSESGNAEDNIDKLLSILKPVFDNPEQYEPDDLKAKFVCAMVYVDHYKDPTPIIAVGTTDGTIVSKRVGSNGFGYDSIFLSEDLGKTFGEATPEEKQLVSHRSQALIELIEKLS